jgi:hypothetical protein
LNPQHHASTFPLTTSIVSVRYWSTLLTPALTQILHRVSSIVLR